MSYSRPPSVAGYLSAALIVGTITTVVIAAPGAGKAIRIVAINLGIARQSTGAVDFRVFEGTTGNTILRVAGFQLTGTGNNAIPIVEPGIQLTTNNSLSIDASSTVATGTGQGTVQYYIDTIS